MILSLLLHRTAATTPKVIIAKYVQMASMVMLLVEHQAIAQIFMEVARFLPAR